MSLVVLISVRKQLKQRKDLIELVDSFLINNCDIICDLKSNRVSTFAVSQILLLFTEISSTILLNNDDVFLRYIGLLFDCTDDWNKQQGFQFQAYLNIYEILKDDKCVERLRGIGLQIFEKIMGQIENRVKCDIYFECLNAIIQQYRYQIFINEDMLYNTINTFIAKIFSSCVLSRNKSKVHLEGVKNPLYIFELIVQWDGLSDEIVMNMDQCFQPLYETLKTSKDHDLSGSVLKILRLQIQRLNGLKTETALQSIFLMKDLYEKEDILTFEMYKIINFVIQKQPEFLISNRQVFDFFLNLGISGMKTTSRFSGAFDKSLGCLIVHLMMHHFNSHISQESYKDIIKGACQSMKQEFYEQYLETRLSEVILSCIEIDVNLTFQILQDLNHIDKIMDIFLMKVGIFQEVYDKKLYIIGCCKMLACYEQLPFVKDKFIELFTRVLEMLQSIKNEQDFVSKKMEQQKLISEQQVIPKNKKAEVQIYSDTSDEDDDRYFEGKYKSNYDDDEDNNKNDNYHVYNKDDLALKEIYERNRDTSNLMVNQEQEIVYNRKKQLAHTYMHRDSVNMYEDPNDYKKVQKYMQTTYIEDLPEIRNSLNLGALEKNSDNSYDDLRKFKRASKSLKLLYTPLKKLDEFSLFQSMFKDLQDKLGQNITQITNQLTPYQIEQLEEIAKIKRVISNQEAPEEAQAIRKIVKLRKKQQQSLQQMQNNNQMMN